MFNVNDVVTAASRPEDCQFIVEEVIGGSPFMYKVRCEMFSPKHWELHKEDDLTLVV